MSAPMEIDVDDSPSSKKHKKHKKHKHKKSKYAEEEEIVDIGGVAIPAGEEVTKPAIKLKLKIGGHTLTKSVTKSSLESTEATAPVPPAAAPATVTAVPAVPGEPGEPGEPGGGEGVEGGTSSERMRLKDDDSDVFRTKKRDDDTSDEEQAWLDALEKGELDDNGEVKKTKDESLLTARQRSLLHGNKDSLLELPSGYKNPELTEEQIKRRQQRTAKRREQAREKSEKDKKQTLDRLLKKQDAKLKGGKGKAKRSQMPGYRYINSRTQISLSVPDGFQFNFAGSKAPLPPKVQVCGVEGCTNHKKYSCSKTGVPLCSLQCYKQNLSALPAAPMVA